MSEIRKECKYIYELNPETSHIKNPVIAHFVNFSKADILDNW